MGQEPKQGFVSFRELQVQPEHAPAAASQSAGEMAADVARGVGKGAANTVIGLGSMADAWIPGVHRLSAAINGAFAPDTFQAARQEFATPTNTAQKVGFGGEQVGEFFLPTGSVGLTGRIGTVAKIAKTAAASGALTLAQGGSPTEAGVSAGITAAIPGSGGLRKGSMSLERGAQKEMAQALGATKEWAKSDAAKLAPEMLERGVHGSREAMLTEARSQVSRLNSAVGQEVTSAAAAGQTIAGADVRAAIQNARQGFMVADAGGRMIPIEGAQPILKRLDRLDTFVSSLGPDIPFDKAQKVKVLWDKIVSKSGLYGQKATANATDNASAWAVREATSSFRDLLANGSATLDDLNKELGFWKGMRNVLVETGKRTQAQAGTGLVAAGTGGAGAVIGAMSGDSTSDRAQNAIIGGIAGRNLVKAIQSPAFRTTITGPMKQKLAEALASGSAERVSAAVGRIVAAMPAEVMNAATTTP